MAKPKTAAGPTSAARLKSFVERIEKLREEKKAIGQDERDVFSEAKGVGYDAPTIRWLLKEREIDAADRDERDALRDTYAHALGMAVHLVTVNGVSLREAGRQTGVSKSSIQRAIAVPAVPEVSQRQMVDGDLGAWMPPHDPETGEIERGDTQGSADRPSEPTEPAAQAVNASLPPVDDGCISSQGTEVGTIQQSCEGRGVEPQCHDNPAPHGLEPSKKGPTAPGDLAALPIEAGQREAGAGNAAMSELHPESALRAAPSQDANTEINPGAGAADAARPDTDQAAAPPEAGPIDWQRREADGAEDPPALVREIDPEAMAEAIIASEDDLEFPEFLDRRKRADAKATADA